MNAEDVVYRAEKNGTVFTVYHDKTVTITPPPGMGVELDKEGVDAFIRAMIESRMLRMKTAKELENTAD